MAVRANESEDLGAPGDLVCDLRQEKPVELDNNPPASSPRLTNKKKSLNSFISFTYFITTPITVHLLPTRIDFFEGFRRVGQAAPGSTQTEPGQNEQQNEHYNVCE